MSIYNFCPFLKKKKALLLLGIFFFLNKACFVFFLSCFHFQHRAVHKSIFFFLLPFKIFCYQLHTTNGIKNEEWGLFWSLLFTFAC